MVKKTLKRMCSPYREWICISKDLKWKHNKPSAELDFDKLGKNCKSFKVFPGALTSTSINRRKSGCQ
jgi:hypothetical protein